MMDVELSAKFNENIAAYETMIYYKTAVLIEAAAAVGAMLAGLETRNFKIYGKNLGLAFQTQVGYGRKGCIQFREGSGPAR